jgi:putative hydrolases of HD superfamily
LGRNKKKLNLREISSFLNHFYKLKEVKRSGWKSKLLLNNPESVAEHTLSMIALAMIIAEYNNYASTKIIKLIKMTLIHDLGETIIGDYMPDTIKTEEKKQLEDHAINDIISKIPWIVIRDNYIKIWSEFRENKTDASRLIHLIDKLDMAIQAKYYMENNKNINKNDVKPFFDSALKYVIGNSKSKNNKTIPSPGKNQNLDEIEQILLYLNN